MPYEFFHDSPPLPSERRCRRGHPGRWARRSMRALMGLSRTLGNIFGRRPPWRSETGSNSCWYPRAGTLTEVGCMVSAKGNRANSNAHGFAKPGRKNKRFARLAGLSCLGSLGVDWRWLTHSCWGPGGSVGFELATGKRTTIARSDLDIVVYANEHLSRSDAQRLLVSTRGS